MTHAHRRLRIAWRHAIRGIGRTGRLDRLALPSALRFGCLLCPVGPVARTHRRYRPDTLILETDFDTEGGAVRLIDFMPLRDRNPDVVRIVEGLRGQVRVH